MQSYDDSFPIGSLVALIKERIKENNALLKEQKDLIIKSDVGLMPERLAYALEAQIQNSLLHDILYQIEILKG